MQRIPDLTPIFSRNDVGMMTWCLRGLPLAIRMSDGLGLAERAGADTHFEPGRSEGARAVRMRRPVSSLGLVPMTQEAEPSLRCA